MNGQRHRNDKMTLRPLCGRNRSVKVLPGQSIKHKRSKSSWISVYLFSEQSTGQKATAVAESPTSKTEEHGLISAEFSEPSGLHGPHTITWTQKNVQTRLQPSVFPHLIPSRHILFSLILDGNQHLMITFLSRLDVTKYLLSGLQSHDQMIRLWMAVSLPVCA